MSAGIVATVRVSEDFRQVSDKVLTRKYKKRAAPFSLRLSVDERKHLEQLAGSRPLGAYIRERLLGGHAEKRRELRKPKINDEQYASLLAALGQSRLSNNLNQLAKSANMGTIDVSQDTEQQLKDASNAVLAMREALFTALGLKSGASR